MTGRRAAIWLLSFIAAGCGVAWIFHTPYRPSCVYRAIPADATIVSAHRHLAVRWDELAGNPITASLLTSLGVDPDDIAASRTNAPFRLWLDRLASDETVIAFVPKMGPYDEPAWIFASWIGGRSQRLRWWLNTGRIAGFRRLYDYRGHRVWEIDRRMLGLKPGPQVAATLVEGMLVGAISASGANLAGALDAYDGTRASLTSRSNVMSTFQTAAADRAWFAWKPNNGSAGFGVQIDDLQPQRLAATVRIPWSVGGGLTNESSGAAAPAFLGSAPLACVSFDGALINSWLVKMSKEPLATAKRLVFNEQPRRMVVAVLRDEYGSRWKGIKVPTLLVGGKTESITGALARVESSMDFLNARFRWGLVPESFKIGSNVAYAIESTSDTPYAEGADAERLAYTADGDWLVFSSSLGGLTNLLQRKYAAAVAPPTGQAIDGWIDLAAGARTFRLALTAWSVKLAFEDAEGSRPLRQKLNDAKAWMDTLSPLGSLHFSIAPADTGSTLKIEAGTAAAHAP